MESLIRLSQAHARLMYKDEVEVSDAVAVILIMESSASVVGGLGRVSFTKDNHSSLYSDPMNSEFPDDDKADVIFEKLSLALLYRYDLCHLIGKSKGEVES